MALTKGVLRLQVRQFASAGASRSRQTSASFFLTSATLHPILEQMAKLPHGPFYPHRLSFFPILPVALALALSCSSAPGSTPDAAAFCTQIDDVAVTGFVDLQRLGVAITVVNDDIVAVVGSDWVGFQYERALELFDVQDPSAPQLIGSHYAPGKASAVEAADGYAYLADAELGLVVFDIGDPTTPVRIGHYEQLDVFDVKLDDEYAYVSFTAAFEETDPSGFLILDLGDRTTPSLVGSFDTIGGVHGLAVKNGHAFVTNESVLRVVDVRDVTNPIEVASYDTGDVAFNVEVVNEYAYIANFASGIHVVDISDLEAPRFVTSVATDIVNFDVTIAGKYAYVPDDMSGLKLLDLEDPRNPVEIDTYRPPYWARDVVVIENYAFVVEFLYGNHGRLYCVKMCNR